MIEMAGKPVAAALEARLLAQVLALKARGCQPHLAVLLVGEDAASQVYVRTKVKAAERLGILASNVLLPATATQREVEVEIARLNADPAVHGILCQLPLPAPLNANVVVAGIDPLKDVDALTPTSAGLLALGTPRYVPCTPAGILELLRHYQVPTAGKLAVVLGRSNIVGRPLSILLSQKPWDASVVVCHSQTNRLDELTRMADLLVAAIGKPEFVTADMVREGSVVIDVGMNRVQDARQPKGYRLCGDVDYARVAPRCAAITPAPGGVGPMTVMILMRNTVQAAQLQTGGA